MTNTNSFFGTMILLLLLAAFAFAVLFAVASVGLVYFEAPTTVSQHALAKHGSAALVAQRCLDGRNTIDFINPDTGRNAKTCMIEDAWYIVIQKGGEEITSFIFKNGQSRTLDQLIKYFIRQGYTHVP